MGDLRVIRRGFAQIFGCRKINGFVPEQRLGDGKQGREERQQNQPRNPGHDPAFLRRDMEVDAQCAIPLNSGAIIPSDSHSPLLYSPPIPFPVQALPWEARWKNSGIIVSTRNSARVVWVWCTSPPISNWNAV